MNDMTYELGDNNKRHEMATIEQQRDNWKETARFHLKNEQYYQQRAELYAALLRDCLWWMEMSHDNPPGLLPRIEAVLSASAEDVAAMLKELAGGDA